MENKLATFYINNQLFGIDSSLTNRLEQMEHYTQVPDSPDDIIGLTNIRGQIISVFDPAVWIFGNRSIVKEKQLILVLKAIDLKLGDTIIKEAVALLIENEHAIINLPCIDLIEKIDLHQMLSTYIYKKGEISLCAT